jgi:hypothetical protein
VDADVDTDAGAGADAGSSDPRHHWPPVDPLRDPESAGGKYLHSGTDRMA